MLARRLKQEIETLPIDALRQVEDLVKKVRSGKHLRKAVGEKKDNVFELIADSATAVGINDLARNHDYYLYGTEKRT